MQRASVFRQVADGHEGAPDAFLNALLRGRRSRLYEGERLGDLVGRSVEVIAARLAPQAHIADDLDLERALLSACVADFAGLLRHLGGGRCRLFLALLQRYPVENLKVLLRHWTVRESGRSPQGYLIDLPPILEMRSDALVNSTALAQFIANIPIRCVRDAADSALEFTHGRKTALLEMAFDRGYWLGVREAAQEIPGRMMETALEPVVRESDALRVLATLRAARVYNLPWETLQRLLAPAMGDVSDAALRSLYEAPDAARASEVAARICGRAPTAEEAADVGRLEDMAWRNLADRANRQYYARCAGFPTLISYYYLRRNEFRDLLKVIHMTRYGRDEDEVRRELGLEQTSGTTY